MDDGNRERQEHGRAFPFPPQNPMLSRHSEGYEGSEEEPERPQQVSQAEQSILRGRLGHDHEAILHQRQGLMLSQGPPISPDAHTLSPSYLHSSQGLPSLSPTLGHQNDVGHTSLFPFLENVTSLPGLQVSDHTEPGESSGNEGTSDKIGMTWLDAAQQVLEEAGTPLHIKEIKRIILASGLVHSSSKSSLEAVLYRETQKGSKRFKRIDGRFGVFALLENAALCDEVARTQEKLVKVKDERKFLLKRLLQYQTPSEVASITTSTSHSMVDASQASMFSGLADSTQCSGPQNLNISVASTSSGVSSSKHKEGTSKEKKEKSKQKKEAGKPIFPIVLGSLTVYSLGDIQSKSNYHNEDYIYPIGFCSTRIYCSMNNPQQKCLYTCKILDGGISPRFEIDPEDNMEHPIISDSATVCHSKLLKSINSMLGKDFVNHSQGSGPEFFGFSHPTIQNLIQSCPGARKCTLYKWKKFEPCKPSERDDIIASMGENDPALVLMLWYELRMLIRIGKCFYKVRYQL
uniref:Transforming growth factor beta regulator 1-like n=1 Tax=Saccoglossus kowalevskii TaxID=10224 RepID=A0ABM0MTG6_SACKO|nr:PREDICTED: transforming growth factor beta regulator 1-like [Saccoglossus kowalevskii]